MRNSLTHPLQIDAVPFANGVLGLTLSPGRKGLSVNGPAWDRDLGTDLAAIRAWGATTVVTLMEEDELAEQAVATLGAAIAAMGLKWLHLPIADTSVPDKEWVQQWPEHSAMLHQAAEAGEKIVIHCKAGLERTSMIATLLLCERGDRASEALKAISDARVGARPLPLQKDWLRAYVMDGNEDFARVQACLIGGAIGDSLGAEIEFWDRPKIEAEFPTGIDRIMPHDGMVGAITDDTQMTLFVAEGLILANERFQARGICHPASVVHLALLRWLATQGETSKVDLGPLTGLALDRRLWRRRAPGMTCLSSLRASSSIGQPAENDSKGCGAVMRAAPIGLFCSHGSLDRIADETSALTHAHQTGRDAARAFAHIIFHLYRGETLEAAISALEAVKLNSETRSAIAAAMGASPDGSVDTVEELGEGWVADEALAIAIYAARTAQSFEHGLKVAVTHSGDSDSTGAIAGNMLGLIWPDQVRRHRWKREIQCSDLIFRQAKGLVGS